MCVIMLANRVRPTEEMIERAFDWNKDGAGIAWRGTGGENDPTPYVYWKKGLNLEEVKDLCKHVPIPYVVHFRVASVGGVRKSLTHPFPVGPDATLALEGRTTGSVLFHNGHWNPWADKALDAAISTGSKIPAGDWSDSRAMAWMVNIFGPGFMELLREQKGLLFGPTKDQLDVFTGTNGWEHINNVWCSNDFFWTKRRVAAGVNSVPATGGSTANGNYHSKRCNFGKCQNTAVYGKDLCWGCERDSKDSATKSDAKSDDESAPVVTKPTILIPAGSGSVKLPLDRALTLLQVEQLFEQKKMSQRKLKKFRQYYSDLGKTGNKAKRATAQLWRLSLEVATSLSSGSGT